MSAALVATLVAHQYEGIDPYRGMGEGTGPAICHCTCEWTTEVPVGMDDVSLWAAHVADKLMEQASRAAVDRAQRLATPVRPYPEDVALVAMSESAWEEARHAEAQVPELQDALANANAYAEKMPDRIADYLLSYSAGGDTSDPQGWQAGHNYAMREAARMVREKWFDLGANPLRFDDEGRPTP